MREPFEMYGDCGISTESNQTLWFQLPQSLLAHLNFGCSIITCIQSIPGMQHLS